MYDEINTISLRLSSYCNLNCKYCYQKEDPKEKNNFFNDFKALNKFLLKLPLSDHVKILITGGEPSLCIDRIRLAYKNIMKIARYIDTTLHFSVFTNGTNFQGILDLIDDGIIDPYISSLSWDGINTTKSRMVKNPVFTDEFFNNNIKLLGRQCEFYRNEINIRTAATRDTIENLAINYKYILENNCYRWEYYIVNDESIFFDDKYLKIIEDQLREIYTIARDNKIAEKLCNLESMLYMYFPEPDEYTKKRLIACRHLGETLFINTKGEIYPCALADSITKIYDGIKFGSIYTGLDRDVLQEFCNDYNIEPSCKMMYNNKPCKFLHCFECAMTCKHCNKYLNKKSRNQCKLREIEYKLFKEIFIDYGYEFDKNLLKKYKFSHLNSLKYNPELYQGLPFIK